jgi:tetratricopeptide (TPR) repeat protein
MAKLTFFIAIIFLVVLGLLAFFNKGSVELTVWEGASYQVPVIALILISGAVGILSMFIIVAIRDVRRYVESWQVQRQQKKESKIQESYSKGLDAFFASRYKEASELFTRVIEDDPSHLNALLRLGDIFLEEKEFTKARASYFQAKEIKPRSVEALLSLVNVSEAQQKWQEAVKYVDSILEIDDENPDILYKKRGIYERNKKWEELLDVQQKILKCKLSSEEEQRENRNLLGYKYELGRHCLEIGDMDKAVKTLKNILKTDKDFSAVYLTLAEAYVGEGKMNEAEEILAKGYEETSSLVFLARLEDLFITIGEPGAIIDLYQKEIQKDRSDLRLQFFLAKLYFRLEMLDYAFDTINSMDTTAFDYPELHVLLGSIYERRAEYEKAVNEFNKILNADRPSVVPFCCSNCHYISKDWAGRCPECKRWNTFILDIHEVCKTQKRQNSS